MNFPFLYIVYTYIYRHLYTASSFCFFFEDAKEAESKSHKVMAAFRAADDNKPVRFENKRDIQETESNELKGNRSS